MLNKVKQGSNMYAWATHTWNPINGKCMHDCSYCYMKVFPIGELHISEKHFKDNLGKGNTIFVGSSTDMFADNVPKNWISDVLKYCCGFDNKYLFQTKNPIRFKEFIKEIPKKSILGITLEREVSSPSKAPQPFDRVVEFSNIHWPEKMVSIEPIMDFDPEIFLYYIKRINPVFVSIGADSKGHNLPEPKKEKVIELIAQLKKFTKVIPKDNLNRLL